MKLQKSDPNTKKIRNLMSNKNAEDYTISRQGKELHFFGLVPGSLVTGWYFVGYYPEVVDRMED